MDGMAEFIFIAVIIALTMAEGVGRRRKRAGKGPLGQPPTDERTPAPAGKTAPRPSGTAARRPAGMAPTRERASRGGTGVEDTSEGLIPADVWDEILGLARGEGKKAAPPPPTPPTYDEEATAEREETRPPQWALPPQRDGTLEVIREVEARTLEPLAPVGRFGAARSAAVPDAGEVGQAAEKKDLRQDLFRGASAEQLRKAIILKEVLGLPVALREEWRGN